MLHDAILRAAFALLLDTGRPIPVVELAAALGASAEAIDAGLAELDRAGRVRRNEGGDVVASRGLSLTPTPHEITLAGERRFTWCAYDAVGILAALGADGRVRSRTPLGEAVEFEIEAGHPVPADGLVLFLPARSAGSVVEEWCPLANFFLDADAAQRWASEGGVEGHVLSLAEASKLGAREWGDCCERRTA